MCSGQAGAGGYGIRPYGAGAVLAQAREVSSTTHGLRANNVRPYNAAFLDGIVGRGLDLSAGRCKKRPAGAFPVGRSWFCLSDSYNN